MSADALRPYTMPEPPVSGGRTLLASAFAHYCVLEWGLSGMEIEAALEPDGKGDGTRSDVRALARQFRLLFARGDLRTFARPIGGGAPVPIPAAHWELDDFDRRFASSAIAMAAPFDPAAAETHWVFVDTGAFQGLLDRVFEEFAPVDERKAVPETAAPGGDVTGGPAQERDRWAEAMLRLPEVSRRTGLSRSTIYDRVKRGSFPEGKPLGGGLTAWRERDVQAWIEALGT